MNNPKNHHSQARRKNKKYPPKPKVIRQTASAKPIVQPEKWVLYVDKTPQNLPQSLHDKSQTAEKVGGKTKVFIDLSAENLIEALGKDPKKFGVQEIINGKLNILHAYKSDFRLRPSQHLKTTEIPQSWKPSANPNPAPTK